MIDTTAEQARFAGKILCYVAIHSPITRDDRFAIGRLTKRHLSGPKNSTRSFPTTPTPAWRSSPIQ